MSVHDDIVFKGLDGTECEAFIRAVRKAAFSQGKQRDAQWMADFAETCFEGEALRWHQTLSDEVQTDWKLLQPALLAKYPAAEQPR